MIWQASRPTARALPLCRLGLLAVVAGGTLPQPNARRPGRRLLAGGTAAGLLAFALLAGVET